MRSNMVSTLTMRVLAVFLPAVLAIHTPAWADIQRRELMTEVPVQLELASGRTERCTIKAWSEEGLEGSSGVVRWDDLRPGSAVAALKVCVTNLASTAGDKKVATAQAAADAGALE